jgi:hypothetical protein
LGPVLAEFKEKRQELIDSVYDTFVQGCENRGRQIPDVKLPIKITAQGGVGTAEEHRFLLEHYNVDSVGWGTPFMLVPEATTVDDATMDQLANAVEKDLYLSDISPLGVPFNSLRSNTKDVEKLKRIEMGKPGSPCPKRYVALDQQYTEKGLCTASHKYQKLKIEELEEENLSPEDYLLKYDKIVEKSCTCVGLGTSALLVHGIDYKVEGPGVSVCPGPNMAYFNRKMTLKEMVGHIYGKVDVISRNDRPNMFIKELKIYVDYLKDRVEETTSDMTKKQEKYLLNFTKNMNEGIAYYRSLFTEAKDRFEDKKSEILSELDKNLDTLQELKNRIETKKLTRVKVR